MNYTLDDWMPEEVDFKLFHIYCHLKDYRLCWALNEQFRCKMVRVDDFLDEDSNLPSYAQFYWKDDIMHREFYLISNKPATTNAVVQNGDLFATESRELLIPEVKKVDYFLQVYGQFTSIELEEIEEHLNMIQFINAAKMVDTSSSKSYLNLMH
ncbi:IPExxxVDY family protein [Flavobacteriales bacterium]|nr:IPExxxVDY family protein [Flavobacteriales bacterium]